MADLFPTALQRTSDERWVTLEVVAREPGRVVARLLEDPAHAAVIRMDGDPNYDGHLRRLLASAPPPAGEGVHISWPTDLLHDLDARAVGYLSPRIRSHQTFALADYVDPARRAQIAPMATRRHHLRVARNTATALAALHHAGHGRIRARQFRLDDRAQVVVVRTDELMTAASATVRRDDERRLGNLIGRLIGGSPWIAGSGLGALLARSNDATPVPAEEWFHVLREAERSLPAERLAARPVAQPILPADPSPLVTARRAAAPLRVSHVRILPDPQSDRAVDTPTDTWLDAPSGRTPGAVSPAHRQTEAPAGLTDQPGPRTATAPALEGIARRPVEGDGPGAVEGEVPAAVAGRSPRPVDTGAPQTGVSDAPGPHVEPAKSALRPGPGATSRPPSSTSPTRPPRQRSGDRPRSADRPRPHEAPRRSPNERATVTRNASENLASASSRIGGQPSGMSAASTASRAAFILAAGLTVGAIASIAPFAAFIGAAAAMFTRAAVQTGKRKSTMGPAQTAAIAISRFIPFATGGMALAAFVLLDLLLVLGLVMALAQQLFEYGPGFTLTWIIDLHEVPLLVRWFAFAVGGASGLSLGGGAYDRLRDRAGSGRMIGTPAFAIAIMFGLMVVDSGILWWPLPTAS